MSYLHQVCKFHELRIVHLISSVLLFVVIVLLLAFDFWTVKNVSGRLLCGLRWWNETGPDGESVWVFESADPQRQINSTDSKVFWITLYAVPVLWLLLALVAVLKFQFMWLTIVGMHPPSLPPCLRNVLRIVVALILNMANVLAFTRCDKDQKRKWATNAAVGALSSGTGGFGGRIMGAVMGRFFR